MAEAARRLLDSLCGLYLKDETLLLKQAHNYQSGQMLVLAAYSSLPRSKSTQVQKRVLSPPSLKHLACAYDEWKPTVMRSMGPFASPVLAVTGLCGEKCGSAHEQQIGPEHADDDGVAAVLH
jgi:hypothetical protein